MCHKILLLVTWLAFMFVASVIDIECFDSVDLTYRWQLSLRGLNKSTALCRLTARPLRQNIQQHAHHRSNAALKSHCIEGPARLEAVPCR